jgi:hypothetical protein
MSYNAQRKLGRKIASVVIGGTAVLVFNSGMALAAYGPPPPPRPPVPGGFNCVVTSQAVGPAGKVIGPVRLRGLVATLRVRPGSFAIPGSYQITITQPTAPGGGCQSGGPGGGNGGFRGYRTVGGIGIFIQRNGSAFKGTLLKPLILSLTPAGRSSLVVVWNGMQFVAAPGVVIAHGVAMVPVPGSGDYLVLQKVGGGRRALSAAAVQPESGASRQVAGEELLGVAFLLPAGSPMPGLGVVTTSSTS